MGADDLVEDRLVEGRRRIPEHVRAVHDGHVLGPHLVDQRIVVGMREPRAVRGRHVEHIVVPRDRTPVTGFVDAVDDSVLDDEATFGLVLGHLPGQFAKLGGTLVEP
ncbi:hypothetical protein SBADM41S_09798 [Streptomyces badius]